MRLADVEVELKRLDPKPGDIVHVAIARKVAGHEMDEIKQSVRRFMPDGVAVMLTTPETSVTLECRSPRQSRAVSLMSEGIGNPKDDPGPIRRADRRTP